MKRKFCGCLLIAIVLCQLLSGCGGDDSSEGWYYYHLDEDGKALETDSCEVTGETVEEIAASLIEVLCSAGEDTLFPEDVTIEGYSLSAYTLTVDFSGAYYEMDTVTELLCRAAVVETLLQVDGISVVCFTVEGEALTDADGEEIGRMTSRTFITNPASQINSTKEATVTLYFTDADGQMLYAETQTQYYFSSVSVEWMVVQWLIDGPEDETGTLCAVVPSETYVINVNTADGICYVNLDQTFLSTTFTVSPQVAVYAIVNSLCEIDGIDSVQIMIDGSTEIEYQDTISLNQIFTMNEDLIADEDPFETEVDSDGE